MPLSDEVIRRLEESTNWPKINIAMLHPIDIKLLAKEFSSMISEGIDYTIEDLDSWLKARFLGVHEDTRMKILDIARDAKNSHT